MKTESLEKKDRDLRISVTSPTSKKSLDWQSFSLRIKPHDLRFGVIEKIRNLPGVIKVRSHDFDPYVLLIQRASSYDNRKMSASVKKVLEDAIVSYKTENDLRIQIRTGSDSTLWREFGLLMKLEELPLEGLIDDINMLPGVAICEVNQRDPYFLMVRRTPMYSWREVSPFIEKVLEAAISLHNSLSS